MEIKEIKQVSILDYLNKRGIAYQAKGNIFVSKSPIHKDSSWSLAIYPNTNSFYDWSAGYGGSIIDLVMAMEGCGLREAIGHLDSNHYQQYTPNYKSAKEVTKKQFEYTKYLTTDPQEIAAIKAYADTRRIRGGFEYGVIHTHEDGSFIRNPSIMFLHRNAEGQVVGAKFRFACPKGDTRFSSRGEMHCYILEYMDNENYGPSTLYVVEGEANANSLWQYCQDIHKNAVVLSFGGVSNLPTSLPTKYLNVEDKRLIIDYDGNESAYNKRINNYKQYELEPIRLILDKGQDINSLYINKEMNLIKNLLL